MLRIVCYQDHSGEWRWRMVARNGRIIADSAESYRTKSNVRRAAERIASQVRDSGWPALSWR